MNKLAVINPPRLVAELNAQFAESAKLEQAIKANLRGLGYGG
jgi:type I restriction enzyme M protein